MVPDAHPSFAGPLAAFLPRGTAGYVAGLLAAGAFEHRVEVHVSRPRRTKLGDHRGPGRGRGCHRITINDDLNPYAFLTTLLHEIAHAATWERHRGRRIRPHGPQWKAEFGRLLEPVVTAGCLPEDVAAALASSITNPAAATCTDRGLLLALSRYDRRPAGCVRVEQLPTGSLFRIRDTSATRGRGRVFRLGARLRSRYRCFEVRTGGEYRVHALIEVEPAPPRPPATTGRRSWRRRRAAASGAPPSACS